MEEYLGLSFTNRSVTLACTKKQDTNTELISIQDILYPFPFEFNALLNDENIELLAERLLSYVSSNNFAGKNCVVSLPMYLVQMKRAAIPLDLDSRVVQKHLKWEVENLNSRDIDEYKIVKLDYVFSFGSYQESVFILIQKKLLRKITELVEKSSLKLQKVLLDSDTILKHLTSKNLLDPEKNQLIFQVDVFNITALFYIKGKFYNYSLHSLAEFEKEESFEQKVLSILKAESDKINSIAKQLPGAEGAIQVFVNRLITEKLYSYIKKSEMEFTELSIHANANSKEFSSNNIEAFAVTL